MSEAVMNIFRTTMKSNLSQVISNGLLINVIDRLVRYRLSSTKVAVVTVVTVVTVYG
jgi:hypothetical protein